MKPTVTRTTRYCARCGEHHVDLQYYAFTNPVQPHDVEYAYTEFAICPKTEEPILFAVIENK